MKFQQVQARSNWKDRAQEMGYLAWMFDNPPYWTEALPQPFCAEFSVVEIRDMIMKASAELTELGQQAVEEICNGSRSEELFDRLRIPVQFRDGIRASWRRKDPTIYGRFDFAYSDGKLKLLEMNFDTALALFESSIFQLVWFEDLKSAGELIGDQYNSLHDQLIKTFAALNLADDYLHFACLKQYPEDWDTSQYLQSCAIQAKVKAKLIEIKDLSYDDNDQLMDGDGVPVKHMFKLYPWQFLFADDSKMANVDADGQARSLLAKAMETGSTKFIEPPWKVLLSSKAVMSVMWDLQPDCPWLLESRTEEQPEAAELKKRPHARKPIFGMEGTSVSLIYPGQPEKSFVNPGPLGKEGFLLQELCPLPKYENYHVLIGSWVIGGKPAGIGIRADRSPVTTANHCIFVPHYVNG